MGVTYVTVGGRGYLGARKTRRFIAHFPVGHDQLGVSACYWIVPGTYQEDD